MREKKEWNVELGAQIRLARERAMMTQELLAERVDVSPQYVSDLERGVVGVSIPTLKRICLALRVSSDRLLFPKQQENEIDALAERCKRLPKEQFAVLMTIVNGYFEAIDLAQKR